MAFFRRMAGMGRRVRGSGELYRLEAHCTDASERSKGSRLSLLFNDEPGQ
jgi:hypothetical protein